MSGALSRIRCQTCGQIAPDGVLHQELRGHYPDYPPQPPCAGCGLQNCACEGQYGPDTHDYDEIGGIEDVPVW